MAKNANSRAEKKARKERGRKQHRKNTSNPGFQEGRINGRRREAMGAGSLTMEQASRICMGL